MWHRKIWFKLFDIYSNVFDDHLDIKKINLNFNLSELLLPDLNLNIDNTNYLELTHEGYQLKWI